MKKSLIVRTAAFAAADAAILSACSSTPPHATSGAASGDIDGGANGYSTHQLTDDKTLSYSPDSSFSLIDVKDGYFAHSLHSYGRTGQPCDRCFTPIRRIVIGGRSSHFCPRCQKRR